MNAIGHLVSFILIASVAEAQREVVTTFKKGQYGSTYEVVGYSPKTTLGDTNTLNVVSEQKGDSTGVKDDSRWVILSVEDCGKRIAPKNNSGSREMKDLETPDKYVAVTYMVGSKLYDLSPPPVPRLIGTGKQVMCALSHYEMRYYTPDGMTLGGGTDKIPAGALRKCWALYEMGNDIEIESVEIFPTAMSKYRLDDVRDPKIKGKRVSVSKESEKATISNKPTSANSNPTPNKATPSILIAGVPTVRLQAVSKPVKGHYYEGELRLKTVDNKAQHVTVKVFFIASPKSSPQDLVFDIKEIECDVEPNKFNTVPLRSDDIREYESYYFKNARLNGISPKGAIIQIWCDSNIIGWASMSQWQKYKDSSDIIKQMGELKRTMY